jgi:predicted nucleic acid-binding protein
MIVFADTSAIYAVLDHDDGNHRSASKAWERLLTESAVLLTSNYVLLETSALVQHRLGMVAFRALCEDVSPILTIEWVSENTHKAAVEATLTASRKKLSLVDCVSFQLMRAAGVRVAFCFDRHFREQGFQLLP